MRIMPFWIKLLLTLNKDLTPSSLIHSRHWKWTLPWGSLMPLHLQSLLGFSTWLVPFLIILSCSLVLAFVLINCGARLGLFLPPCLSLPRCQHLKLIHYFSSHPAAFGFWASTPPDDISLNSCQQEIFRLVLVLWHMLLLTHSNSFLISRLPWLILFPDCQRLREMLYLCLKCMNYFSRFMAFWKFSMYSSTFF